MTKYAIFGGGGAFAINVAHYLLTREPDCEVIGIGRNPLRHPAFSLEIEKRENYRYKAIHLVYEQDFLFDFLDKERPDVIINFAAQGESAASWAHSWRFYEMNAMALVSIVGGLQKPERAKWLKQFIHIGTSEVYGSCPFPVTEDMAVNPTTPYAASKLAFDHHLLAVSNVQGFPMTILRPSNCYCPGQQLHRIVPKAMVCGLSGRKLPLQGGGVVSKSYMAIGDLSNAIHLCATNPKALGQVYNVGPKNPIPIHELVLTCAETLDMKFEDLCEPAPGRVGEDLVYWLDSKMIAKDLGWKPLINLKSGLNGVRIWAKNNIDFLKDQPMEYVLRA